MFESLGGHAVILDTRGYSVGWSHAITLEENERRHVVLTIKSFNRIHGAVTESFLVLIKIAGNRDVLSRI